MLQYILALLPAFTSEPPIVQVREFPHSSIVSVVAWSPDESAYGLRAGISRQGSSLIRDHRLSLSTYRLGRNSVPDRRTYLTPVSLSSRSAPGGVAETATPARQLVKVAGIFRDDRACFYDVETCTPFETIEVRLPDEMLRANRDSVAVRLYGRGGTEMIITVRREIIDAYLAKVDSVSAALRKE